MATFTYTMEDYEAPPPADLLADLAAALGLSEVSPNQSMPTITHTVKAGGRCFVLTAPYRRAPHPDGGEIWLIEEIWEGTQKPANLHTRPKARLTHAA